MGIQDLQVFLESGTVPGSCVPVDLVRIAKTMAQRLAKQAQKKGTPNMLNKFSLVVDGECCLDRLYGGFFSDWACGGQWNRMVTFLSQFVSSLQKANIDLVVFFNGCVEQQRMNEWITQQQRTRDKVNQVLKHINTKGTPPPKVWWTPPVCLRTAIRMVLRHLDVSVVCTMDDHRQEVIAYCRENNFHGLIADDAEYAAFDPPRYFSARQLKLTYKGSLESKEYNLQELNKGLGLNSEKLCVLAALLGNYLLTEHDLLDVYKRQGIKQPLGKIQGDQLVKALANLVKSLPSVDNLDAIAIQVFDLPDDIRAPKLKQSIQYYLDGTKDGFLNYRSAPIGKRGRGNKKVDQIGKQPALVESTQEPDLDTSKLASETEESKVNSLKHYKEATAGMTTGPEIIIDHAGKDQDGDNDIAPLLSSVNGSAAVNGRISSLLSSSSSSSSSNATSPARVTPSGAKRPKQTGKDSESKSRLSSGTGASSSTLVIEPLPPIPPEVMRTVSERHSKGLMSPCIYQILTQGEIKLPVLMEEEQHKEVPNIHLFYRPIRQMVYAILFNLHHHTFMATKNKEKTGQEAKAPEIKIKEWVCSKGNQFQRPDIVKADALGWGVPTVQRLWFGTTVDDMRRRRRGYLTCMRSDTPLIVNYDYVPQHILIMATVLRYMMSFPDKKVLRRSELDAFIMTALSSELMNAEYNQDLQLAVVTSRGVQLATMFMQGVETALLVNDACGAPIPWLMCCPWLFFDGKLFHHQLARASQVKNLMELCEHRIRIVMKVERMRQAILEGLNVQFARPPLPIVIQGPGTALHPGGPYPPPPGLLPAGLVAQAGPGARGLTVRGGLSPRGIPRRSIASNSGGRLEIAGVVVGSWGPNYGLTPIGVNRSVMLQPQVTSVGAVTNFGNGPFRSGRPTFSTRGTLKGKGRGFRTQVSKKRTVSSTKKDSAKKSTSCTTSNTTTTAPILPKGRGMTMVLPETGETVLASDVISGEDKKKKILVNSGEKKVAVGAGGDMVNGAGGDNKDVIGQFDDANILDGVGLNGEGDAPLNIKTPLIAAAAGGKADN